MYHSTGKVEYCHCRMSVTREERDRLRSTRLYNKGDMVLIWANEGDLIQYGTLVEDADIDPMTGQPCQQDEIIIDSFPDLAPSAQAFSGGPLAEDLEKGLSLLQLVNNRLFIIGSATLILWALIIAPLWLILGS